MSEFPNDALIEIHASALAAMRTSRPRQFARLAEVCADDHPDADLTEDAFRDRLANGDQALLALWRRALTDWDFAPSPEWATGVPARTEGRRTLVYDRLQIGADLRKVLDTAVPVSRIPGPTVIDNEFKPWYTPERATMRSFYWTAYESKLRAKGWRDDAIASLDEASRSVVERFTDPEQAASRQTKGLVVGYVQSGKTANFTGVTAKAIDAGYRLVIVLGGTLNLLRAQTQRRLDMELIGQENILRGADPNDVDTLVGIDYIGDDDEEWIEFVSHGARPSTLNAFDIERLTTRDNDYKSLAQGIRALEFEKREPTQPLYDPANLHYAAARVLVVKKNKSVLTKLIKDLKQMPGILGELPTLIIDDESDQASVNTMTRKKWEEGHTGRKAINGLISQLLGLLPRAQYVGYTATPFANVFVDPGDAEDIFPGNFLISLPRPHGYMGVQDFHDLEPMSAAAKPLAGSSNEQAHVRDIYASEGDDRLQEALDAFVLSGAVKLYRQEHGVDGKKFRHHTMLVHESVRLVDHKELARRIDHMWHASSHTSASGHARLADLWRSDFARVSAARADGFPVPSSYEELRPYVSHACQRIRSGGAVVVVNGDTDRDFAQINLDFDKMPTWKILVGGTKLSRGFTVEGLTVTYYRRATQQGDTLMQMGRWFGFRQGYRDLVRLYIGRDATYGSSNKTLDLYKAFEAVCLDEELFRSELERYSQLVDGIPQLTPAQIPPLVAQHLPWLKPTAPSKMFNAKLIEIRSPGRPIEPLAYPADREATARNSKRWEPALALLANGTPRTFQLLSEKSSSVKRSFQASTAVVPQSTLLGILSSLEWENKSLFAPHLNYLAQLDGRLAVVDNWLLISPHLTESHRIGATLMGHGPFSLFERSHQDGRSSFNRISGKEHRSYAQHLVDQAAAGGTGTEELSERSGVVLLYPVVRTSGHDPAAVQAVVNSNGAADASRVTLAFTVIPPHSAIDSKRQLLRFQAGDSRQ